MLNALRKHLKETPKKELKKEFEVISSLGFEGPTAENYLRFLAEQQDIPKEFNGVVDENFWDLL